MKEQNRELGMNRIDFIFPRWMEHLVTTSTQYNVIYGGRCAGKSYSMTDLMIYKAMNSKETIMCFHGNGTIKGSLSMFLFFKERIVNLGLAHHFRYTTDDIIQNKKTGSTIKFLGVYGIMSICSNATQIWIDDAQALSNKELILFVDRHNTTQIWFTMSDHSKDCWVYKTFLLPPVQNTSLTKITYRNNRYFPAAAELIRQGDAKGDAERYNQKWEGQ